MEITGKIRKIDEIQTFESGFRKREVVITTDEQYPQHILIELLGDRSDIIGPYKAGDSVTISINIRGREWVNPQGETKYFNSITGWKIENAEAGAPEAQKSQSQKPQPQIPPSSITPNDEDDDLPF